jgi:hypothetical protein
MAVRCGVGASLRQLDVRNINNNPVHARSRHRKDSFTFLKISGVFLVSFEAT